MTSGNDRDLAWDEHAKTVADESQGLLQVHLIGEKAGTKMIRAAKRGDVYAAAMLDVISDTIARLEDGPALCVCCPKTIRQATRKTIFGIIGAELENRTKCYCFLFCDDCGVGTTQELLTKSLEGLKTMWGDDISIVNMTHPTGGRA